MPLKPVPKNASKRTEQRIVGENIAKLRREGRSQKQAKRIALENARRDKAKRRRKTK